MASTSSVTNRLHAAANKPKPKPRIEDVAKVLSHCCEEEKPMAGALAKRLGLPEDQVEKILQFCARFCLTPRTTSWDEGRNRSVSINGNPVHRQVSKIGQFSYRGDLYSIGKEFDNCLITIVEEKGNLLISAPDRPVAKVPLRGK
jgi:hypothetical protein